MGGGLGTAWKLSGPGKILYLAQPDWVNVRSHKKLCGIISKTRGAGVDGRIRTIRAKLTALCISKVGNKELLRSSLVTRSKIHSMSPCQPP